MAKIIKLMEVKSEDIARCRFDNMYEVLLLVYPGNEDPLARELLSSNAYNNLFANEGCMHSLDQDFIIFLNKNCPQVMGFLRSLDIRSLEKPLLTEMTRPEYHEVAFFLKMRKLLTLGNYATVTQLHSAEIFSIKNRVLNFFRTTTPARFTPLSILTHFLAQRTERYQASIDVSETKANFSQLISYPQRGVQYGTGNPKTF